MFSNIPLKNLRSETRAHYKRFFRFTSVVSCLWRSIFLSKSCFSGGCISRLLLMSPRVFFDGCFFKSLYSSYVVRNIPKISQVSCRLHGEVFCILPASFKTTLLKKKILKTGTKIFPFSLEILCLDSPPNIHESCSYAFIFLCLTFISRQLFSSTLPIQVLIPEPDERLMSGTI